MSILPIHCARVCLNQHHWLAAQVEYLIFLKLSERIYALLPAGLLQSSPGDTKLQQQRRSQLDRLYQKVADDLNELSANVGLKIAA